MALHRRLEHGYRDGSAYFVTWRLAGSLPVERVIDLWTVDGPKFVASDRWLDAAATGPRWLERSEIACLVVNTILTGAPSRYELGSWVLMPNHVHIVIRPCDDNDLGSAMRWIKGASARAANDLLSRTGSQFWAKDYFDCRIRDLEHEDRVVRYIENNPVTAGLCQAGEDWPWSSAAKKRG